jgi:hypothetical protein
LPTLTAWEDPGCPIAVDYSREALEQIRSLTVDGLLALPRIGIGVGGLLLGVREAGRITILDSMAIPCSHADGPSFNLTPDECEHALDLVRTAGPLTVVGWYCSKTRGLIAMHERDLILFGTLCPEAWQVTLLIRPSTVETSQAALCFRDAAGVVLRGRESPLEFFGLAPVDAGTEPEDAGFEDPRAAMIAKMKAAMLDESANTIETSEPVEAPYAASPAFVNSIFVDSPVVNPSVADPSFANPSFTGRAVKKPDMPPVSASMVEIPLAEAAPPEAPPSTSLSEFAQFAMGAASGAAPRPRSRMGRLSWVLAASVLVAGTGAAWFTRHDWMPRPPLRLSAADAGGKLTIRWNRDAIPQINSATLTLNDGGEAHTILLDSHRLDAGTVQYERKSNHVDALLQADGLKAQITFP